MTAAFEDRLRGAGYRLTPARKAVLAVLCQADAPLSALEVWELGRARHSGLGRATVYRTLLLLVRLGLVRALPAPGGVRYRWLEEAAHRLVCRGCGEELPLSFCPADTLAREISERYGYLVEGHLLEFYGLCPDCQRRMGHEP
ncbi:transcriptional repressor [Candidatus Bipolaricaulota bacterium]|nr:transcriptional repressor [Candidatus Bipolaricaulota bacterium]